MFSSKRSDPRLLQLGAGLLSLTLAGTAGWAAGRQREQRRSARFHRSVVDVLLNVLSAGDPITARHSQRVANLTNAVAERLGVGEPERATLRIGALLHDMGKIDDRFFHIVHSRDPLTDEQRNRIEHHPHESAHILKPLDQTHPGLTVVVASHHECWNGSGYPKGRAGEEIPLAARIISLADVFDAMTQPRAYRDPLSTEEAFALLRSDAGSKFDPALVALLDDPAVRDRWTRIARRGRAIEQRTQSTERV